MDLQMMILNMTEGARAVAQNDPHGLVLTLISIAVVFSCLFILFLVYGISGKVMSDSPRTRRHPSGEEEAAVAAAIALAMEAENTDDGSEERTAAAIALALALESRSAVHDNESYRLTFRDSASAWGDRSYNFRKNPTK